MENSKEVKIIIVDDSKEFCNILNEYLLNVMDIVVIGIANDGIEALKLIQEKRPDLVILDIIMPNFDGLKVLEKLNTMSSGLMPHVLILSAIGEKKIIQRAMELGADNYIVKPFEMNVLLKMISQIFATTICSNVIKKQPNYYKNTKSEIKKNQS